MGLAHIKSWDGLWAYASGSEKGVFWKRGLFRKIHVLESLENLEILAILENPQICGKQSTIRPFSSDSRESRDFFRDSRDSSSEKTPFVMTPFSGPECRHQVFRGEFVDVVFRLHKNLLVWRTVLGSSRGPCYQRDLPMQELSVNWLSVNCLLVVC